MPVISARSPAPIRFSAASSGAVRLTTQRSSPWLSRRAAHSARSSSHRPLYGASGSMPATSRMVAAAGVGGAGGEDAGGGDRRGGGDGAAVVVLAGPVDHLRGPVPGGAVPPVAAGAEQQRAVDVVRVRADGVVVAVQDHGPAVVGVPADDPCQVMPPGVGGVGDPPGAAAGPGQVVAAPGFSAGMAADRLDRGGVVDRDVRVVRERQAGDGVVGAQAVRHRAGSVQRQRSAPFKHECCKYSTALMLSSSPSAPAGRPVRPTARSRSISASAASGQAGMSVLAATVPGKLAATVTSPAGDGGKTRRIVRRIG